VGFQKPVKLTEMTSRSTKKKDQQTGSLVPTYHPSLEKIAGIVRHHWKEIEKCETLAKLFP
jgi:Ethanolamine utilization protein EutJ (predicted chaperonin)